MPSKVVLIFLEEDVSPKFASRQKLSFVKLESGFEDIGIPKYYFKFCK